MEQKTATKVSCWYHSVLSCYVLVYTYFPNGLVYETDTCVTLTVHADFPFTPSVDK